MFEETCVTPGLVWRTYDNQPDRHWLNCGEMLCALLEKRPLTCSPSGEIQDFEWVYEIRLMASAKEVEVRTYPPISLAHAQRSIESQIVHQISGLYGIYKRLSDELAKPKSPDGMFVNALVSGGYFEKVPLDPFSYAVANSKEALPWVYEKADSLGLPPDYVIRPLAGKFPDSEGRYLAGFFHVETGKQWIPHQTP